MPIPSRNPKEEWGDFMARCMSDEVMKKEYPDEKQRFAVCNTKSESVELDLQVTEDVQEVIVFPYRKVWLDNYGVWKEFNEELADEIIKNFNDQFVIKPIIDKEHEYRESYGDVLELYKKEDGLYAKIKLNPAGVELVKNRVYKGLSPSIGTYTDVNKTEHKNVLLALSLVNYQGLGTLTPELQEQLKLKINFYKEAKEMKAIKKIAEALELKLREDVTDEEIDGIVAKIKELEQLAGENEELKNKIKELETEVARLKEQEEEVKQSEAEQAVQGAVEAGFIPAGMKEIYKKRYLANKDEFILEMKLRAKEAPKMEMKANRLKPVEEDEVDEKLKTLMLKAKIDINDKQAVKNFVEYFKSKEVTK